MPFMKITGEGVCWIAVLTSVLWGCLVVERLIIANARTNGYRALEQIRELQLKKTLIPAAAPAPRQSARPLEG